MLLRNNVSAISDYPASIHPCDNDMLITTLCQGQVTKWKLSKLRQKVQFQMQGFSDSFECFAAYD